VTCHSPQGLALSITEAVGNDYFFSILKDAEMPQHMYIIRKMCEMFLSQHAADEASHLQGFPQVLQLACNDLKAGFAGMLALLEPLPGYLGTSPADATLIRSYTGTNSFLSTLRLHFEDNPFWQTKLDSLIKRGSTSIKVAPKLRELVQKLQQQADSIAVTPEFIEAVNTFTEMKDASRDGATTNLLKLLTDKVKVIAAGFCALEHVDNDVADACPVLRQALDLCSEEEGVLDVKKKFLRWQGAVAGALSIKQLSSFAVQVRTSDGPIDVNMLSQKLLGCKHKPLDEQTIADLQICALKLFTTLRCSP
jgi:hypothetical protein